MDVGLLGAVAQSPIEPLAKGEWFFNENLGAFVENFIAQQLISHFHQPLYYWRSKGGKAELDFLCEFEIGFARWKSKPELNLRAKV